MTAPRFRLCANDGHHTLWAKISEDGRHVRLTSAREAAYVASRESIEALNRRLIRGRSFKEFAFHMEEAS